MGLQVRPYHCYPSESRFDKWGYIVIINTLIVWVGRAVIVSCMHINRFLFMLQNIGQHTDFYLFILWPWKVKIMGQVQGYITLKALTVGPLRNLSNNLHLLVARFDSIFLLFVNSKSLRPIWCRRYSCRRWAVIEECFYIHHISMYQT